MNWAEISEFNFTFALLGGAWLKDKSGNSNWFSFEFISGKMGNDWISRQLKNQGWMTGCWVKVI